MEKAFVPKILILLLLFIASKATAQVQVTAAGTAPFDPVGLINNVFLGQGVTVLNVTFKGKPVAVGYFTAGLSSVGLERGIVMTTGQAVLAEGPNNSAGAGFDNNSNATDPDLTAISTAPIRDAAIYEITFIPIADTLRFRYSFGSDEYPEFACQAFNDVFGFFISGPGITGPYQNSGKNIALIPNTNLPVSINNVHPSNGFGCPAKNIQYYNAIGNNNASLQYDGITDVFTATAVVVPCQTYKIKLVIADAQDDIYDSGVFLEAKSFGTGRLETKVSTVSLDGSVVEGCSSGSLTFKLPQITNADFPLDYKILGTALNGIDYQTIPTDLKILAGQDSISIPIIALEDGVTEINEIIGIDIRKDLCTRDTIWITVRDNKLIMPNLGNDTSICRGDSVQIFGKLNVQLPSPPTFTNATNYSINPPYTPIFSDILVNAVLPTTLSAPVIQSVCINLEHRYDDDLDIYLISPGGQFLELSTDNGGSGDNYTNTCFTPSATNPIDPNPGPAGAPASATPFTGTFKPEGIWSDLWDSPRPTNGTWRLQVTDDQAETPPRIGKILNWTITFNATYQLYYRWTPALGLSCSDCPNPIAKPDQTTNYRLFVTDSYGCVVTDSIKIEVQDKLLAPDIICINITNNSITFNWNTVTGATNYEVNINGTGWVNTNNGLLSHIVGNLVLNESTTIQVRGVGNCGGIIGTATCTTPFCASPSGNIIQQTAAKCYGSADGTATVVSAVNTFPPYTYKLGNEINATGLFTGLAAGTYNILVIDGSNCSGVVSVTIQQPSPLSVQNIVKDTVSCFGKSDGRATVKVNGGIPNFTFLWSNNSTDSVAIGLKFGKNYVTITDVNGCQAIDSIQMPQPNLLTLDQSNVPVGCAGAKNGKAIVTATGGNLPYQFLWDLNANGQTNDTAFLLNGGSYSVTVTDKKGCFDTQTVIVGENAPLLLQVSSVPNRCFGENNGSAAVFVSAGVAPYAYLWSDANSQNTSIASGLPAGNFGITVTDDAGCKDSARVDVTSPPVTEINLQTDSTSCFSSNDGKATLNVTGGTPIFSYQWSDDLTQVTNIRTGLLSGSYGVTVTDGNACRKVLFLDIFSPDSIRTTISTVGIPCSGGANGSATVTAYGGSKGFEYQWDDPLGQTSATANNLNAGKYHVTVTDKNGCQKIDSAFVSNAVAFNLNTVAKPTCPLRSTGSATVNVTGGTGNLTYQWSDPLAQTTATANNLSAGNYTATVTDAAGCVKTVNILVAVLPDFSLALNKIDSVRCAGDANGAIDLQILGGTQPFTYTWTRSDGTQLPNSEDALALTAGKYNVSVKDANGCKVIFDTFQVFAPAALTLLTSKTDVKCNGGNDGLASVQVSGGIAPYTYLWSDNSTNPTLNNIPVGNYSVTVKDANNCNAPVSNISVSQPAPLAASTNIALPIKCFGGTEGSISAEQTGGTSPFTYLWSNGQTSKIATNLAAGTQFVTITDANNCQIVTFFNLSQPNQILINLQPIDVKCYGGNDGKIVLAASGGVSNYSFQWSGIDGFSSTDQNLQNLSQGNYSVTLTDANGCLSTQNIVVGQPSQQVVTNIISSDTICNGANTGFAQLLINGGTTPYSYLWSDGQTNQNANNLVAGTYTVRITDAKSCIYKDSVKINTLPAIAANITSTTASCYNTATGSASVTEVFYGNSNFTLSRFSYLWDTNPIQTNSSAQNLQGGSDYQVTISDARGCKVVKQISIPNPEPVVLAIQNALSTKCFEGTDGTAEAVAEGGIAPYTFKWDANAGGQTTAIATQLRAGNYAVTTTDFKGCVATQQVTIGQPSALQTQIIAQEIPCFGESTGALTAPNGAGGTAPYQWKWSNGATGNSITGLKAGLYALTFSDANGCEKVFSAQVRQPDELLKIEVLLKNVTCFGARDGSLALTPSGGTPPYRYSTDGTNFNGANNIIGLKSGDYNVTVRDANGCLAGKSGLVITQPESFNLQIARDTVVFLGDSVQLFPIVTGSPNGSLTYEWKTFAAVSTLSCLRCPEPFAKPTFLETYFLTVTDENGCQASDRVVVGIRKNWLATVPTGFSPNGDAENDRLTVYGKTGTRVRTFRVYDRWGEELFFAKNFAVGDTAFGWDGTFRNQAMSTGVYIWWAEVVYPDGSQEILKGEVTLLR